MTHSACVWAGEDLGPQKVIRTMTCTAGSTEIDTPERTNKSSDAGGHGRGLVTAQVVPPLLPPLRKSLMKLQTQQNDDCHGISCRNREKIRLGVQTGC